jgi:N-acetyltransferase
VAGELEVRGPSVRLRLPRTGDARRLFELGRDPEVTHWFSWGPYRAEAEAAAWIASMPERRADGTALELVIAGADDAPLGVIAVLEVSRRDRRCVNGIWLGRPHWGTGVNREAQALFARLAFEALRMERIGAWVDVRNGRSQRSFERLGYANEGVLRAWQRHGDERRDLVAFSLLRDEWLASALARVPAEVGGEVPAAFVCAERA